MSFRLLTGAAVGLLAVACSVDNGAAETETAAGAASVQTNSDVQVISAKAGGTILWGVKPAGSPFDASQCTFSNRKPYTGSSQANTIATADCTDVLIRAKGPSINRYIEPVAYLLEKPSLSYASFRNWCAEVEVVVAIKAAAWDDGSFEGVGFYGYAQQINQDENQRRVFYTKGDARLKRIGEATLKNEGHQKAYLYKFSGAGPCEPNGSGDNPGGAIEFKPFVTFRGGHDRWEAVTANHSVSYGKAWDRKGDLLD